MVPILRPGLGRMALFAAALALLPGCVEGEPAFIGTAVADGLRNNDMLLFAHGIETLGFRQEALEVDVTRAALAGYLASDVELLYHTGHGEAGAVRCADGALRPADLVINARNTVFATCRTLADPRWRDAMGPGAQTILGYARRSIDVVDTLVAKRLLAELGQGRELLQSWYLANVVQTKLLDRWVAYARDGGEIVRYSVRSVEPADPEDEAAAEETGEEPPLSALSSRADALAAPTCLQTDVLGGAGLPRDRCTLSPEEAVARAGQWLRARGALPQGAALASVRQLLADSGDGPVTAAQLVVYGPGSAPEGNGLAERLTVLLDDQGVFATTLLWPSPTP